MKCNNCGAEVADGMKFCTSCGSSIVAPTPVADDDRTVLVDQSMLNPTPAPQPNMGMAPNTQFTPQPNMGMPQNTQFTGQPNMGMAPNTQYTGQPNIGMAPNTQYTGQPNMGMAPNTQYTGQPSMGMAPNTQYTGQPQMNMYNQQPYGQPNQMYNQTPKAPPKPLSPKAKKGILIGAIAAVVLIIFFAVILPILTRADLKGEYVCKSSYSYHTFIFDGNTYIIYDEDHDITEIGNFTYNKDNGKIKMYSYEGYESEAKFNDEENTFRYYGDRYKSTDKKEKTPIQLPKDYVDELEDRVEEAAEDIFKDDYSWGYYSLYDDDLKDPFGDFEKDMAKALDYDNDKVLQFLMEEDLLSIDVSYDSDGLSYSYVYPW